MKKEGFTLAEVLITLGIIGVVASMTLPSVMTNTREKESVAKLKKVYSVMSQAYMMAKSMNGTMDTWGMSGLVENDDGELQYNQNDAQIVLNKLTPFLKTTRICGNGVKGCWYDGKLKGINGTLIENDFGTGGNTRVSLILADGTLLSIVSINPDCSANRGGGFLKKVCGAFAIDVNGEKKPNQVGRDIFQFYFAKEGVVPYGTEMEKEWSFPDECNVKSNKGWGCAAWVIYKENMDYLHCEGLSWNGKSKCK